MKRCLRHFAALVLHLADCEMHFQRTSVSRVWSLVNLKRETTASPKPDSGVPENVTKAGAVEKPAAAEEKVRAAEARASRVRTLDHGDGAAGQ